MGFGLSLDVGFWKCCVEFRCNFVICRFVLLLNLGIGFFRKGEERCILERKKK